MITQTFYISTGRKNAMFTLRYNRFSNDPRLNDYMRDNYVRTLAATIEKAQEKAAAYFEAWKDRVGGDRDDFRLALSLEPDNETYQRRGKLSVADTKAIEMIEDGVFPFGKNYGKPIVEADAGYLLFFADKLSAPDADTMKPVFSALCTACLGAALEKGYIAKREVARAERAEADAKSEYVGAIGERRVFTGTVVSCFFKSYGYEQDLSAGFWITKVRVGDDLVTYVGKKIAERDATITFKATIKRHDEYKGVKSTVVNRPVLQ